MMATAEEAVLARNIDKLVELINAGCNKDASAAKTACGNNDPLCFVLLWRHRFPIEWSGCMRAAQVNGHHCMMRFLEAFHEGLYEDKKIATFLCGVCGKEYTDGQKPAYLAHRKICKKPPPSIEAVNTFLGFWATKS
tara:strand:+ start:5855 stop:6265 length:411 start_codon:yes stop_codon:yes gene_type:complete